MKLIHLNNMPLLAATMCFYAIPAHCMDGDRKETKSSALVHQEKIEEAQLSSGTTTTLSPEDRKRRALYFIDCILATVGDNPDEFEDLLAGDDTPEWINVDLRKKQHAELPSNVLTPAMFVAYMPRYNILKAMVSRGATIPALFTHTTPDGKSALTGAITSGEPWWLIKSLLAIKACPDGSPGTVNPLIQLCKQLPATNQRPVDTAERNRVINNLKTMEILIEAHADTNKKTTHSMRFPLLYAASVGNREAADKAVQLLLAGKAYIDNQHDQSGLSALIIACRMGNDRLAKTLLANNALVNTLDAEHHSALFHTVAIAAPHNGDRTTHEACLDLLLAQQLIHIRAGTEQWKRPYSSDEKTYLDILRAAEGRLTLSTYPYPLLTAAGWRMVDRFRAYDDSLISYAHTDLLNDHVTATILRDRRIAHEREEAEKRRMIAEIIDFPNRLMRELKAIIEGPTRMNAPENKS